jgi:GGDEF domain-containing protein
MFQIQPLSLEPQPELRPFPEQRPTLYDSLAPLSARIERQLARGRRHPEQTTLLWIEMDTQDPLNEVVVNAPRPDLARAVGARILNRVRRTDEVFQVGHKHFVVLLDADLQGTQLVESRLKEQALGPYGIDGWTTHVRFSMGAATLATARQQGQALTSSALADWLRRQVASVPET